MNHHYKNFLLPAVVFFLSCLQTNAQQFKKKTSLQIPDTTGFYGIDITPALSGFVKPDLTDIRILDDQQKQVPFIIRDAGVAIINSRFDTLPIIKNMVGDSGRSVIIVKNTTGKALNGIALVIKNADVQRNAALTGSNDGKNWFSIVENIYLGNTSSADEDIYMQQISFPLSTYNYLRITIDNNKNAPLNVTAVVKAVVEEFKRADPYIANPPLSFTQKDSSDNYSYVFVKNDAGFHIGKLSVAINGPKFFKRALMVETGTTYYSYNIQAGDKCDFVVPVFNDKKWLIKIYNGDNPPLAITSITTYQSRKQLVTYLEAGKKYELDMNNATAVAPSYELQNFKDSIPQVVNKISIGTIENIIQDPQNKKTESNKIWLWITLVVVLLILSFFTVRLVKEMKE